MKVSKMLTWKQGDSAALILWRPSKRTRSGFTRSWVRYGLKTHIRLAEEILRDLSASDRASVIAAVRGGGDERSGGRRPEFIAVKP